MPRNSRFVSEQSKTWKDKQKKRNVVAITAGTIAVLSWVAFVYVFFNHSWFSIGKIDVVGTNPEIGASLQARAGAILEGKYMGLFSRDHIFIYPKKDLEADLPKISPKIESVEVNHNGYGKIEVDVKERKVSHIICAGLPQSEGAGIDFEDNSECYLADSGGLIFEKAPDFSGDVYPRFYIPELAEKGDRIIGSYATSTGEFADLDYIYKNVESANIQVLGIFAKEKGEYEVYFANSMRKEADIVAPSTGIIYLNRLSSFAEQINNLATFWDGISNGENGKLKRPEFEYIDLRYGNNIFYR